MKTSEIDKKAHRKSLLGRLALWTFGWVFSIALVAFGRDTLWGGATWITALFLGLSVLLGIGMISAHRSLILNADELQVKIQLESMGLTLGLTLVAGLAYSLMDKTDLISWEASIPDLVQFMAVCYIVCLKLNTKRYS